MTIPIKDRTAIVGIGQTAFGKGLLDSELSLACQAISMAIDDAGLRPSDVDGLAMYSMENGREVGVARNVGLGDVTYFGEIAMLARRYMHEFGATREHLAVYRYV